MLEAATGGVPLEQLFRKNLEISQKSPFVGVFRPVFVNVLRIWLLLSIIIPTKEIFVFSLCSFHRLKVLKNRSEAFSFSFMFLQVIRASFR